MANGRQSEVQGARRLARTLALVACGLALALGAWRASVILASPAALHGSLSSAEASLLRLVEPVTGPGKARISIARNAEGGRTVLVLLDASARETAFQLERIIPVAAGLTSPGSDRVVIEEAEFARGLPGRPDMAGWAELGVLALIVALCAWLGLRPAGGPQESLSDGPREPAPVLTRASAPGRASRTPAVLPAASEAGDLVRRDPARAAAVVRAWIGQGEDRE